MRLTEPISFCNQATAFSENTDTRGAGGAIRPDSTSEAVTRPCRCYYSYKLHHRLQKMNRPVKYRRTHIGMHPRHTREAGNRDQKQRSKVARERPHYDEL
jgi:hypothetical protein